MKLSNIIAALTLFTFISCANSANNDHGHDHGPNGEHLDDMVDSSDGSHKQESFEIKEEASKVDSAKNDEHPKSEHHSHTHSDGSSHSH
ncbi:MAG: hypothetical protein ACI8SE_002077 [Bacteroidia bacterium]|jgi:hypothetical protein